MKRTILSVFFLCLLAGSSWAGNIPFQFCVDPLGNDNNSGSYADNSCWATVAKVNAYSHTNLALSSESFDNATSWSIKNTSVGADNAVGPDGNGTADTIFFASNGYHFQLLTPGGGSIAGRTFSISVYIKSSTKATIMLRIFNGSGADGAVQMEQLTSGYVRYSIVRTFTNTETAIYIGFDNRVDSLGDGIAGNIDVFGAHLEETSNPTPPYIPTVASPVTASFQPSDNVLFKRGQSWAETLTVPSSGTASHPITFGAYGSGAAPILDQASTRDYGILTNGKSYLNFSNLNVTGAVIDGIYKAANVAVSSNLNFDNVSTSGNGQYGYLLYGVDNSSIKNSAIGSQTRYDGIYIGPISDHTASTKVAIDNNTFTGTYGRWPLTFTGCDNCTITNNTINPTQTGAQELDNTVMLIDLEPNSGDTVNNIDISYNTLTSNDNHILSTGIQVTKPSGSIMDNTTVHHNAITTNYDNTMAINFAAGTPRVSAHHNTIDMKSGLNSMGIKLQAIPGTTYHYNNTITGCGTGAVGFHIREGTVDARVYNNRVSSPSTSLQCNAFYQRDAAVAVYSYNIADNVLYGSTINGTGTATFYNNIFYNFTYMGLSAYNSTTVTAKNNIFSTTDAGNTIIIDNTSGVFTYDYNLYNDTDVTSIFCKPNSSTCYSTLALWKTASGQDAHSVYGNPLFVSSSDFRLQASSPARNTGVNVGLTTDYLGNGLYGAAYDIGSYEMQDAYVPGCTRFPCFPTFPTFPSR